MTTERMAHEMRLRTQCKQMLDQGGDTSGMARTDRGCHNGEGLREATDEAQDLLPLLHGEVPLLLGPLKNPRPDGLLHMGSAWSKTPHSLAAIGHSTCRSLRNQEVLSSNAEQTLPHETQRSTRNGDTTWDCSYADRKVDDLRHLCRCMRY